MTEYLDGKKQSTPTTLDHLEAARTITSSPYDDANIGIDAVEAERLQVKTGDLVSIAPTDTGEFHASTHLFTFLYSPVKVANMPLRASW